VTHPPNLENDGQGSPPSLPGTNLQRTGEPKALRALADGGAVYRVPLNAVPDPLWRSLFLEQTDYLLDFVPALVHFTYHPPALSFPAEEWQLARRVRLLDQWIERTNQRCSRLSRTRLKPEDASEAEDTAAPDSADGGS
jgi:hypothetical protein